MNQEAGFSPGELTAVDHHRRTVDEGRVRTAEPHRRGGDLLGQAETADGDRGRDRRQAVGAGPLDALGADCAGQDGVDPDSW
jgi:hypothetical protein